jgi:hypothetical protein
MGKIRDRPIAKRKEATRHCLTPDVLLEFEAVSLAQMATLPWPRKLSLWKDLVIRYAREARNTGALNAHFSFEAEDPRAKANSEPHQVELGVQIALAQQPLVTYFFAIGQKNGNARTGLRKIHFDLESTPGGKEPKPGVHFQIAGRSPPVLMAAGYESSAFDHLIPDLDKPRIPCLPPSFALLAHVALLEYHSTDAALAKFVQSSHWIKVVTTAENSVLLPYFDYGHTWLNSAEKSKASLLTGFYER